MKCIIDYSIKMDEMHESRAFVEGCLNSPIPHHGDPLGAYRAANTACESMEAIMQEDPNNVTDVMRQNFVLASLATSMTASNTADHLAKTRGPQIMSMIRNAEECLSNLVQHGMTLERCAHCLVFAHRAMTQTNYMEPAVNELQVAANVWYRTAVRVNSEIDDVAMRIDPARIVQADERRRKTDRILMVCTDVNRRVQQMHAGALRMAQYLNSGQAGRDADARRSSVTRCSKGECKNPRRSQGGSRKKRKTRKTHRRR